MPTILCRGMRISAPGSFCIGRSVGFLHGLEVEQTKWLLVILSLLSSWHGDLLVSQVALAQHCVSFMQWPIAALQHHVYTPSRCLQGVVACLQHLQEQLANMQVGEVEAAIKEHQELGDGMAAPPVDVTK